MARRYKKVDGGHGHHGGAWKVAYADFVTAMMALFMVLWLLATTDSASRKEISNYFRSGILPEGDMAMNHAAQINPSVIEEAPTPPPENNEQASFDEKEAAAKQISDKLGRLAALDEEMAQVIKNVKIKITPEGILIETVDEGDNLLFESSSSKLNAPLQKFLRAFAPMVVKVGRPLEINGHTDARRFAPGSKLNNWDLSYQRANAARQILEENGVPTSQMLGLFARGSSQLFDTKNPLAPQNRRLSFLLRIANQEKPKRLSDMNGDGIPDPPVPETKDVPVPAADAATTDEHGAVKADEHAAPAHGDATAPAADAHGEAAKPADAHGDAHATPADAKHAEPAAPGATPSIVPVIVPPHVPEAPKADVAAAKADPHAAPVKADAHAAPAAHAEPAKKGDAKHAEPAKKADAKHADAKHAEPAKKDAKPADAKPAEPAKKADAKHAEPAKKTDAKHAEPKADAKHAEPAKKADAKHAEPKAAKPGAAHH